ncbi:MAG TPA: cobalamin-dependent protein [Desulfobacteria bacterium]|nr:cobalamin-dependent protein [Desulfobacteria bacterium]
MSDNLFNAMVHMRETEALETTKELLKAGADAFTILDTCTEAMENIGKRFEEGKYFLPELMLAGEILKQISELVKPHIKEERVTQKKGRVLVGTVEGDIHDIGKDMVVFLLDVSGYEVLDIGIDAPPEEFVKGIRDFEPQVVGMSGLLTLAYDSMKNTVDAIREAGLRDQVKIMLGGGQISEDIMEFSGADAIGGDAVAGVNLTKKWIGA